jgi:anaerobic ribonucleoside-triphosphate reductase activating protein
MKELQSGILSRPDAVNVAHMVERCTVLGPGVRFVVWTQGCSLRCPGCHNPQFQPFESRNWLDVGTLANMVLGEKDIEGLTLVGGEPFFQAEALVELSRRVRAVGLSVMAYSGFTLEQLQSDIVPHAGSLLREIDLLMDGPYRLDLPTERIWRGSDNQRLISLSHRYEGRVAQWDAQVGQQFEVRISAAGEVEFLGIWPAKLVDGHPGDSVGDRKEHNGNQGRRRPGPSLAEDVASIPVMGRVVPDAEISLG